METGDLRDASSVRNDGASTNIGLLFWQLTEVITKQNNIDSWRIRHIVFEKHVDISNCALYLFKQHVDRISSAWFGP